jgi:transposase
MKRFIEGADRTQVSLLPDCVDDYVGTDNPVRVIEAFIDQLDLREMGFESVDPEATGRPAYHPAVMLKIYIYGYLNRVQSSRRLEHESQRNIEVMWLTGRLMPDFKTIANFRKDNGKAIRRVCRQFIVLCRELNLFSEALVAIDGSKFKAVNNRDKNFTTAKMKRRMAAINESIERYLTSMDTADRAEPEVAALKKGRLQDKIDALKQQMEQLKVIEAQMNASPDKQVSLTDPDARSMKNREGGIVGYNVQTAVDAEHHLIVAHEVTNEGVDRDQLSSMAQKAKDAIGTQELTVVADRGYFKSELILWKARRLKCGISDHNTATRFATMRKPPRRRDLHYLSPGDQLLLAGAPSRASPISLWLVLPTLRLLLLLIYRVYWPSSSPLHDLCVEAATWV